MGKLILLVCGVLLAWWLLKTYRKTFDAKRGRRPPEAEDMVQCAQCGVHMPRSESRTLAGKFFCSDEHMKLHGSHTH